MSEEQRDDLSPGSTDADSEVPVAGDALAEGGIGDEGASATASEAWREVLDRLSELATAVGRWGRSAIDDPENRERADELMKRMEAAARSVGDTLGGAWNSESAEPVREAAAKAHEALRDAGGRVTDEVAPRLASALSEAAERLNGAVARRSGGGAGAGDEDSTGDSSSCPDEEADST